jgi:PKD repeat protein
MADRISTLDAGYVTGDLSLFPEAIDDKESLYEAKNNAETVLTQALPFNARFICVEDASAFPEKGLIRIGPREGAGNAELIYYGSRTNTSFNDLARGFAGARQTKWSSGAWVTASIMAEHHNAIMDAIFNIQARLGTREFPAEGTLNALIKELETKHIAPKASFRAFPRNGPPPLAVRFQNFSNGDPIRFIWDFGDGTGSIEKNPTHIYQTEGVYTVKLNMVTSTGSQCSTIKSNYITVDESLNAPFFYIVQDDPSTPAYSIETATQEGGSPAVFNFVDQTDGDIASRLWVFDDGTTENVSDRNDHSTTHIYDQPGQYNPFLLLQYTDQKLQRVFPQEPLVVL